MKIRSTRDEKKQKVILALRQNGRSATNRVAGLTGIDFYTVNEILNELSEEGSLIKTQESLGTYWEINRGMK